MSRFTPCLWFNNQAQEAATFYTSIFKNSKIGTVTYYTKEAAEISGQHDGSVLTVTFIIDGQEFMALNGGPQFQFSEAISFIVNCKNQEEIDFFWEKLSQGGSKGQCGWLKDKFGVSWQIVPVILDKMMQDKDSKKTEQVMSETLKMTKLDIKKLEEVYHSK